MPSLGLNKSELAEFLEVSAHTLRQHINASGILTELPKLGSFRATIYGTDVPIIEKYFGKSHLLRRYFGLEQ